MWLGGNRTESMRDVVARSLASHTYELIHDGITLRLSKMVKTMVQMIK